MYYIFFRMALRLKYIVADYIVENNVSWTNEKLPEACIEILRLTEEIQNNEKEGTRQAVNQENFEAIDLIIKKYKTFRVLNLGLKFSILKQNFELMQKFIDAGAKFCNKALYAATLTGDSCLADRIIVGNTLECDWKNHYLFGVAKGGHLGLIDQNNMSAHDWKSALRGAVAGGRKELVDFIISKGIVDWTNTALNAIETGQVDLIEFLLDKEAAYHCTYGEKFCITMMLRACMRKAIKYKSILLVNFLINKVKLWDACMDWKDCLYESICRCHPEFVDFFLDKCTQIDLEIALDMAAYSGNMHLVEFFFNYRLKTIQDVHSIYALDTYLGSAICSGSQKVTEFFVEKGADNFVEMFKIACYQGNDRLKEFFWKKLNEDERREAMECPEDDSPVEISSG